MSDKKFCIDCKWCDHREKTWWEKVTLQYVPSAEFAKCRHPLSLGLIKSGSESATLVDGIERREYTYCSIMRWKYAGKDICGPDATLFEPKE